LYKLYTKAVRTDSYNDTVKTSIWLRAYNIQFIEFFQCTTIYQLLKVSTWIWLWRTCTQQALTQLTHNRPSSSLRCPHSLWIVSRNGQSVRKLAIKYGTFFKILILILGSATFFQTPHLAWQMTSWNDSI